MVSRIVSETGNILENLMQMAVWCLQAEGTQSDRIFGKSAEGVYADVTYT